MTQQTMTFEEAEAWVRDARRMADYLEHGLELWMKEPRSAAYQFSGTVPVRGISGGPLLIKLAQKQTGT
jgi:hypothetical protein